MKPNEWQTIKRIFDAAISLQPAEREEFLAIECGGDAGLREKVAELLRSYNSTFLEGPLTGADASNVALAKGGVIGRYEILGLIGVGGMGEVYLARDNTLDRNVAIKVLNAALENSETSTSRFVREAKAASALNHPNILTIYEIGETAESHFIVSEFVDGITLRDALCQRRLELSEVLDISIQTASALAAAHAAKIIHRDIKPENIVLREDGLVKVLDFGLAKLIRQQPSFVGLEDDTIKAGHTTEGLIMGTVSYMSPEQARGEAVDERTDIFSLGVMIYEMIAGRTPFDGGSMSEKFANLIANDPRRLSEFASGVPDELEQIISKMLRKRKEERFQKMHDVYGELKDLKEKIAFETKLHRTNEPEGDRVTAVMPRPTGGHLATTLGDESSRSSRSRLPLILAVFATLLIAAVGVGWYFFGISTTATSIKSLAVLPLKSLDSGENLIGFGIADAVIRKISQTGKLTVRPTSAVRRYLTEDTDALTAAKQLSADAVLEGTVQRSGDRLRVSVNLLRTSDGASLWAESFDTQAGDVFAIQDTVSQQVASRLNLQLDPAQQARLAKRSTSNPVAYEFYVRGVYSFDQRGFGPSAKAQNDATIDFFKRAIEAEPDFALAHAKLAQAYNWNGAHIVAEENEKWGRLAEEEIRKADEIDPQLPETHIARSHLLFSTYAGYQVAAAVRSALLAQQLDANLGHAEVGDQISHIGLEDIAERALLRAIEIDPTSKFRKNQLLTLYMLANRWDDYLTAKQKYFPQAPVFFGYYLAKGDLGMAEGLIAKEEDHLTKTEGLAILLALKGEKKASEDLVPEIQKQIDPRRTDYHHITYDIAFIYAINGNVPEAVKWLRETAVRGNPSYEMFARDPWLDKIRQAPEFIEFMAELKPQYEKYRSEFR